MPIKIEKAKQNLQKKQNTFEEFFLSTLNMQSFIYDNDPLKAISSGKAMIKGWFKTLDESNKSLYGQAFTYKLIESFWIESVGNLSLPSLTLEKNLPRIDNSVIVLAEALGKAAAKLDVIEAGYVIGNLYTSVIPEEQRSQNGIFYTPPSLTKRLLDISENSGINWAKAKIVDPACGGGAFLAPVALRILEKKKNLSSEKLLQHIKTNLVGFEIDPFAAWLSEVILEVALKDQILESGIRLSSIVKVCDSLNITSIKEEDKFDLVIGNPPYGKIKLTSAIKEQFHRSLYGHPNLYGIFTDLSIQLVKDGGLISLLTPTSFLSGEYFKNLRKLIAQETSPLIMDFVSFRKGVFEDVLQETMLACYAKGIEPKTKIQINEIIPRPKVSELEIKSLGGFCLPNDYSQPWMLPRSNDQTKYVYSLSSFNCSLQDWGYQVKTGPLVWNRHKDQIKKKPTSNCYPLIWAESISCDGKFNWKAEKRNHEPYFKFLPGDEWLLINKQCVLLQRTTAKEQSKRLIATALPKNFIKQHKAVVVENHLNMIVPINDNPIVPIEVVAAFINSYSTNNAFRCLSGSVAVSAYELESLPLPSAKKLKKLISLVTEKKPFAEIELECANLFGLK